MVDVQPCAIAPRVVFRTPHNRAADPYHSRAGESQPEQSTYRELQHVLECYSLAMDRREILLEAIYV